MRQDSKEAEMRIRVRDNLSIKFGYSCFGAVLVENLSVLQVSLDFLNVLTEDAVKSVKKNIDSSSNATLEQIDVWRETYSRMGTSDSKRSSLESLCEYIKNYAALPKINPLVDFYNSLSCIYMLPMAAYDLQQINGDVELRFAVKGEEFCPLGLKQVEKTKNGEVVYADATNILCRYWNNRDSDKTKITQETTSVLFIIDNTPGTSSEHLSNCIENTINIILQIGGKSIKSGITEGNSNWVEIL